MTRKTLLFAVALMTAVALTATGAFASTRAAATATFTITATAGDNGSMTPIGDKVVQSGGSVIYTMQPAEGYQVATITVDGAALPPTSTAGSPICTQGWYTFLNVTANHTISVTFKANPAGWYTITPYPGEHGSIWMANQAIQATSTIPGVDVAVSIMPDAGYHVATLVVDGAPVSPATWYIFYNVRAGHTIAATFELNPEPVPVEPVVVSGGDRYETASRAACSAFATGSCDAVVLATGENFADALSGSGLAGALDAPLLITRKSSLSACTAVEIARVTQGKAATVYILGSTAAVSSAVEDTLAEHYTVVRIAGATRYGTSAAVAEKIADLPGGEASTVLVARGDDFPDGLALGPLAYAKGFPVLLTSPRELPRETADELGLLAPTDAYVAGSEAAVSAAVFGQIDALAGKTERVAGANRYATAAAIANLGASEGWVSFGSLGVATGLAFPDALCGGAVCGSDNGVLLLTATSSLPADTAGAITSHKSEIGAVTIFGGPSAVSDSVRTEIGNLLH